MDTGPILGLPKTTGEDDREAAETLADALGNLPLAAARLLNRIGFYRRHRADHVGAEPCFKRALAIGEKTLGPAPPKTRTVTRNIGPSGQSHSRNGRPLVLPCNPTDTLAGFPRMVMTGDRHGSRGRDGNERH